MAIVELDVIRFDLSRPSDNIALLELIKQLRHYPHDLRAIVDTDEPIAAGLLIAAGDAQFSNRHCSHYRLRYAHQMQNRILRTYK